MFQRWPSWRGASLGFQQLEHSGVWALNDPSVTNCQVIPPVEATSPRETGHADTSFKQTSLADRQT